MLLMKMRVKWSNAAALFEDGVNAPFFYEIISNHEKVRYFYSLKKEVYKKKKSRMTGT